MESVVTPVLEREDDTSVASTLYYLLFSVLLLWYIYHRLVNRRKYELGEKLPGPPALPIIGNLHYLVGMTNHRALEVLYARSFEFGSVGRLWIGSRLIVFLTDPRDIELVLGSTVHIDKSVEYDLFEPWFGKGLLISTGEKWHKDRKLIAPTFHLNVLKTFMDQFNTNGCLLVNKLRKKVSRQFDCHDYLSECTVEILLETVMGVRKDIDGQSGFNYAMAVMKMCNILHIRQRKVWLRPNFIFRLTKYAKEQVSLLNTIHSLTTKVLTKKKQEFSTNQNSGEKKSLLQNIISPDEKEGKESGLLKSDQSSIGHFGRIKDDLDIEDIDIGEKKRSAFLDFMLEYAQNGEDLSDQEIKEQVDTIMFEGHDTTAAASSFFLCMMAARPDIQEKVIEELDKIFGDSEGPCTFQDTLDMKYLERCILETLRMYPPVPMITREIKQDLQLASTDLVVPANSTVFLGIFKIHRRPEFFPYPDRFDPDNFLPEKCASRHYYSYFPFSAGPRSCVGRKYAMLKLKVILSTVMRNFKVVGGKKQKDWILQGDIILKRTDGFNIVIEPRKYITS